MGNWYGQPRASTIEPSSSDAGIAGRERSQLLRRKQHLDHRDVEHGILAHASRTELLSLSAHEAVVDRDQSTVIQGLRRREDMPCLIENDATGSKRLRLDSHAVFHARRIRRNDRYHDRTDPPDDIRQFLLELPQHRPFWPDLRAWPGLWILWARLTPGVRRDRRDLWLFRDGFALGRAPSRQQHDAEKHGHPTPPGFSDGPRHGSHAPGRSSRQIVDTTHGIPSVPVATTLPFVELYPGHLDQYIVKDAALVGVAERA